MIAFKVSENGFIVTAHPLNRRIFRVLTSYLIDQGVDVGDFRHSEAEEAAVQHAGVTKRTRSTFSGGLKIGPGGSGVVTKHTEYSIEAETTTCFWVKDPGDERFSASMIDPTLKAET